ncbi:MAG: MBL fold metallo-hydrolase [Candidatus Thermoplasmatota archaeon]|nr:MBL fold metallo-hydrolase [Candidatus Thermoplasmatota archaeon]
MRIRWHGHSCFEIGDENKIVTDPHDGVSIGINSPQVKGDIILVSHDHYDHAAVREVEKEDSEVLQDPGEKKYGDVQVKGIKTYHDESQGEKRGENIIYKFRTGGTQFCHLGDLGHTLNGETIQEIGEVDFLFIPVGGTFTLGPEGAKEVIEDIEPKIAVPMHFKIGGLSLDIMTIEPFLDQFPEEKIHKLGVELDFIPHDLPDETEIWAFSL